MGRACCERITQTSTAVSVTARMLSPAQGTRGTAIPRNPPMTQANCNRVSERAKALVRPGSGTSRWISESRLSLP